MFDKADDIDTSIIKYASDQCKTQEMCGKVVYVACQRMKKKTKTNRANVYQVMFLIRISSMKFFATQRLDKVQKYLWLSCHLGT